MRVWIDVLTPKQALFTRAMIQRAPRRFNVVLTTRRYSELDQFMRQIGLKAFVIGKHGGGVIEEKLRASVDREKELTQFVSENHFDFSFSFISPEAARVSFGVGMKHYICSDAPHAVAPSRLSVPLASKLFSPFPIRKKRWTQYGLTASQVFSYHALDPWAWLSGHRLLATTPKKRRIVLIRLEESFASYMKSGMGISSSLEKLIALIVRSGDFEIILIPRHDSQREWARKKFSGRATVPETTVDGPGAVSSASLLIGGGGTMTQEAAILGVPNISYFPSAKLDVFENFYFPRRLSLAAFTETELLEQTRRLISNLDREYAEFSRRASLSRKSFEDPVKFIYRNLAS